MARNAYVVTHSGGTPDNTAPAMPDADMAAYAVPSVDADAPYTDTFGWAPALRTQVNGEPDAQRLGLGPRYDSRPNAMRPPQEYWQDRATPVDHERAASGVREDQPGQWTEAKTGSGHPDPRLGFMRWALSARAVPPPEPRPTTKMAPRTWSYFRLFDQYNRTHEGDPPTGTARRFTGVHFSMADHRRTYDANLLGMAPQRTPGAGTRNTYRLEPAPWDENIVDMPPPATIGVAVDATQVGLEVPYDDVGSSRSWRLT